MKNTIVFLFLLLSITSFSQQNKWNVGIVGGAGITTIIHTNSKWYTPSPTIGFYTGLSTNYHFNQHFAIHTELAFDRKGTMKKSVFTDPSGNEIGTSKSTNQLNYITLPLLFRASIGNKVQYFIQAGPYLSYLLNQTYKFSTDEADPKYNYKSNGTSNSPTMDFGITTGLGTIIPVKEKFAVSFELRGNFGMGDLYSKGSANTKALNESLNLLIGISYKL